MDQNNQTNDIEQDAKREGRLKIGRIEAFNQLKLTIVLDLVSRSYSNIYYISNQCANCFQMFEWKIENQEIKLPNNLILKDQVLQLNIEKVDKNLQEMPRYKALKQIIKNLENHLQIELIGQQEQMNYFQDNKKTNFDQEPYNMMMELLRPYIHKDFYKTLIKLLELQSTFKINQSDLDDLYNIQKHKHFVSWALVIAWGKKIRAHLELLQKIRNESELTQAGLYAKQLMDKSVEIRKKKMMLKRYQLISQRQREENQKEINEIIKQFRYRNQQNNSEIKQNSYLEVD